MALKKYDLTNIGASFAGIDRAYREYGSVNPMVIINIRYECNVEEGGYRVVGDKGVHIHLEDLFWTAVYRPLDSAVELRYYPADAIGHEITIGEGYNYNTGSMEVIKYVLSSDDVDKWIGFDYYFDGVGFHVFPPYSPASTPNILFDDSWISNISSEPTEFKTLHNGYITTDESVIDYDIVASSLNVEFAMSWDESGNMVINVDAVVDTLQAIFSVLESSDLDSDNGSCDEPTTPPSASTPTSEVMNLLNSIAKVVQNAEGSTSKKIRGSELPSRIQNLLENSGSGGSGNTDENTPSECDCIDILDLECNKYANKNFHYFYEFKHGRKYRVTMESADGLIINGTHIPLHNIRLYISAIPSPVHISSGSSTLDDIHVTINSFEISKMSSSGTNINFYWNGIDETGSYTSREYKYRPEGGTTSDTDPYGTEYVQFISTTMNSESYVFEFSMNDIENLRFIYYTYTNGEYIPSTPEYFTCEIPTATLYSIMLETSMLSDPTITVDQLESMLFDLITIEDITEEV